MAPDVSTFTPYDMATQQAIPIAAITVRLHVITFLI